MSKVAIVTGYGNEQESRDAAGRLLQFDTSVAHQARIYDYWLGGDFLYS